METGQILSPWAPKSLGPVTGSHEIKRRLLLGRKAMTNLDTVLERRDYFADKGLCSQSYGFPVVMYRYDSWTIKKASAEELMALNCGNGEDS